MAGAVAMGVAVLAFMVAVAALVVVRLAMNVLSEVRDQLRVLQVTVYGLEAKLHPEMVNAREAADATEQGLIEVRDTLATVAVSPLPAKTLAQQIFDGSMPFGRGQAMRALFSELEEQSLSRVKQDG